MAVAHWDSEWGITEERSRGKIRVEYVSEECKQTDALGLKWWATKRRIFPASPLFISPPKHKITMFWIFFFHPYSCFCQNLCFSLAAWGDQQLIGNITFWETSGLFVFLDHYGPGLRLTGVRQTCSSCFQHYKCVAVQALRAQTTAVTWDWPLLWEAATTKQKSKSWRGEPLFSVESQKVRPSCCSSLWWWYGSRGVM